LKRRKKMNDWIVNENEKWNVALGNITNLIKDVGEDNADIVVLANGASVSAYVDDEKIKIMKALSEKGVKFIACRNSLKKMCADNVICINEDNLPSFVTVVPAGITEIIKKQQEGYAYVKP
ncbi:MAG TPA: DsrE family protein, partial [Thermodesulfovibrio thiophilus]|nr:DsrE family protein [Thermodesulfovibrio thiophilus]